MESSSLATHRGEHDEGRRVQLPVVVNGRPATIEVSTEALAQAIIEPALRATDQLKGQPVSNWEVKNAAGVVVDHREIEDLLPGPLYVELKRGIGG